MASSMMSNPVTSSDRSRDANRRKKKKSQIHNQNSRDRQEHQNNRNRWRTDAEQQIYSSKLLHALRQVRLSPSSPSPSSSTDTASASVSAPRRGRAVREAADRVLAAAAKGRTRWSRAILTNRLKLKFMKHKKVQRAPSAARAAAPPPKKPRVSILRFKGKNLPAVHRKARVLGRLVPGCKKEPLPVILEEVIDYIPALEMQVRAMTALLSLSGGSTSSSSSSSSSGPSPAIQPSPSRPPPS